MRIRQLVVNHPRTLIAIAAVFVSGLLAIERFPPNPVPRFQRVTVDGLRIRAYQRRADRRLVSQLGRPCKRLDQIVALLSDAEGEGTLTGESEVGGWPNSARQDPMKTVSVFDLAFGSSAAGDLRAAFALVRTAPEVHEVSGSFMGATDSMRPVDGWAVLAVRLHAPLGRERVMIVSALNASGQVIASVDSSSPQLALCPSI